MLHSSFPSLFVYVPAGEIPAKGKTRLSNWNLFYVESDLHKQSLRFSTKALLISHTWAASQKKINQHPM